MPFCAWPAGAETNEFAGSAWSVKEVCKTRVHWIVPPALFPVKSKAKWRKFHLRPHVGTLAWVECSPGEKVKTTYARYDGKNLRKLFFNEAWHTMYPGTVQTETWGYPVPSTARPDRSTFDCPPIPIPSQLPLLPAPAPDVSHPNLTCRTMFTFPAETPSNVLVVKGPLPRQPRSLWVLFCSVSAPAAIASVCYDSSTWLCMSTITDALKAFCSLASPSLRMETIAFGLRDDFERAFSSGEGASSRLPAQKSKDSKVDRRYSFLADIRLDASLPFRTMYGIQSAQPVAHLFSNGSTSPPYVVARWFSADSESPFSSPLTPLTCASEDDDDVEPFVLDREPSPLTPMSHSAPLDGGEDVEMLTFDLDCSPPDSPGDESLGPTIPDSPGDKSLWPTISHGSSSQPCESTPLPWARVDNSESLAHESTSDGPVSRLAGDESSGPLNNGHMQTTQDDSPTSPSENSFVPDLEPEAPDILQHPSLFSAPDYGPCDAPPRAPKSPHPRIEEELTPTSPFSELHLQLRSSPASPVTERPPEPYTMLEAGDTPCASYEPTPLGDDDDTAADCVRGEVAHEQHLPEPDLSFQHSIVYDDGATSEHSTSLNLESPSEPVSVANREDRGQRDPSSTEEGNASLPVKIDLNYDHPPQDPLLDHKSGLDTDVAKGPPNFSLVHTPSGQGRGLRKEAVGSCGFIELSRPLQICDLKKNIAVRVGRLSDKVSYEPEFLQPMRSTYHPLHFELDVCLSMSPVPMRVIILGPDCFGSAAYVGEYAQTIPRAPSEVPTPGYAAVRFPRWSRWYGHLTTLHVDALVRSFNVDGISTNSTAF
ncbi:hypothetical protein R3P38DRAFT_3191224 [Favolaschia claudopus]|uniref:Uncharacterized protein n=1 Tax=Favolaschia claudopus TaxID=2862362 RepID=A0AAW0BKS1_9AGAR